MKLAAVTMVYNEATFLPLWRRYYAAAVGADNCFVVDHGSTDGSTGAIGANRIVLPRSPHDDVLRARSIGQLCAALLGWYDAVLYTDVDELVMADPDRFGSLAAFAAGMQGAAATAVGLNLLHLSGEEPALDFSQPILGQRRWGWFSSAMCKPVLIRRPVAWSPGFHCADVGADVALDFSGLYLFHARYADRAGACARLARTRAMPWADLAAGAHQRVGDSEFIAMLDRLEAMDRRDDVAFDTGVAPLADWLERVAGSRGVAPYRIALDVDNFELWRVPDRFVAAERLMLAAAADQAGLGPAGVLLA